MPTFIVTGQKLSRIDNIGVANLSQKYLKCRFVFDSEWDSIDVKTAIFYDSTGNQSYKVLLEDDNTCIADSRALKDGSFTVTVYGTKEDDSEFVITTNKVLVKMNASGFTTDSSNTEATNPDLIEQIVIKYLNDHAGGAVTPEEIQEAVNKYLEENPIEGAGDVNVQADWNQTDTTADDYIKNKPTVLNGQDGADGRGIVNIVKTDTNGLVDTYTITYTDDTTSTFTITNGKDGSGTGTGGSGADGVGIADISKTSTSGLVDIYTITYTDGNTSTFEVTNGADGAPGQDGVNGKNLEFNWDGTKLGVRQEGDSEYVYVDLKGADGVGGSADIFENKNVIFIGDSFMCGHGARVAEGLDSSVSVITTPQATSAENVMRGYAKAFKDKHNTANVYNLAVYGATIAFQENAPCIYNQFDYLENTLAVKPDYIIMNGGANDVFQGLSIGEITEGYKLFDGSNYDSTLTIPCLEATFSMLLNNNPQTRLIFINPPAMDSAMLGNYEAAINNTNLLIKEVCNKWGVIYLDMEGLTNKGSANSIISANSNYYSVNDKIHPLQLFYTDTIDMIDGLLQNPITTSKKSDITERATTTDKIVNPNNIIPESVLNGLTKDTTVQINGEDTYILSSTSVNLYSAAVTDNRKFYVGVWVNEDTYTQYGSELSLNVKKNDDWDYAILSKTISAANTPEYLELEIDLSPDITDFSITLNAANKNIYFNNAIVVEGVAKQEYYYDSEYWSEVQQHNLFNKMIIGFGDSIMQGVGNGKKGFLEKLTTHTLNACGVMNKAIGGATVSYTADTTNSYLMKQITSYFENFDADIAVINGGVNEAWSSSEYALGEISEGYEAELDTTTFAGALEEIFRYFKITKQVNVIYMTTHKITGADGLKKRMDLALQICNKWGIGVIDFYNAGQIIADIGDTVNNMYFYNGDGCHPNDAGYEFLRPQFEAGLLNCGQSTHVDIEQYKSSSLRILTLEPNTLYDLGTLSDTDELDITVNMTTASRTDIFHASFVAGVTDQSIVIGTSDGVDLAYKGVTDFVVGDTYEISIQNYTIIIG